MIALCKIDGVSYDAIVGGMKEDFEVIEGSNSGTALHNRREIRDLTGIKYAHTITFVSRDDAPELIDNLVDYLFGTLRESVILEVPHNQSTITYEAAYNTGGRPILSLTKKSDGDEGVIWGDLTVEFRSIENIINAE